MILCVENSVKALCVMEELVSVSTKAVGIFLIREVKDFNKILLTAAAAGKRARKRCVRYAERLAAAYIKRAAVVLSAPAAVIAAAALTIAVAVAAVSAAAVFETARSSALSLQQFECSVRAYCGTNASAAG